MTQVLERVEVGESIEVHKSNYAGDISRLPEPVKAVVQAKCEHNSGQWVCSTHKMSFSNQFCKDSHINSGKHRLGWFCSLCGTIQVP